MKNKILSVLLVLCMTLLLLPAGAMASDEPPAAAEPDAETQLLPETESELEEIELPAAEALFPEEDIENAPKSGTCGEKLSWKFEDGVLTISGTGAMTDYDVRDESPAPWYPLSSVITSVVVESGVTTIGDEAFADCHSIVSVTLPKGVSSLGKESFYHCCALESIDLPGGLKSIGAFVFWDCQNLAAISMPDSLTTIGDGAFNFCYALESITIPSSVTSIGESAFHFCAALESIVIPSGVTAIEKSTFQSCLNLKSITIPNSVTAIGPAAFEGCHSLNNVTLPESITTIEYNAFCGCSSLEAITLPSGITKISDNLFANCTSLKSIYIPESVTSVDSGAFANCTALESIVIPESVTTLGADAFLFCEALEEVYILGNVTTIEEKTFGYCYMLNTILLPGSVTSVGYGAFWMCTSLEVVLYTGTEEDLERMEIADGNDPLLDAIFYRFYLESPFEDVVYSENNWYYDSVLWALNMGITAGTTDTTFSPNNVCTRAQAVSFLWRAAGEPEPETATMPFTDVKPSDYYYDAVLWAVENEITAGTTATTFSPSKGCTRGQIVSFLYRCETAGMDSFPTLSEDTDFTDLKEDAYYYTPVLWAAQNGIVAGITETTFAPNQSCTRAQIVTFLYRYLVESL